jgi:hypothetical protein
MTGFRNTFANDFANSAAQHPVGKMNAGRRSIGSMRNQSTALPEGLKVGGKIFGGPKPPREVLARRPRGHCDI